MAPRPDKKLVKLPCSSTRLQKSYAHLKLLRAVRRDSWFSAAFEGPILVPGSVIEPEKLGANPVILECVGPVGSSGGQNQKQYREVLWILWRYHQPTEEWIEIARAQARDSSWTYALREPALQALYPRPELHEVKRRGMVVAETILSQIDGTLTPEPEDVRKLALDQVYCRVAGRLAALAS